MGSPNPVKVNKVECGVQNECILQGEETELYQQWREIIINAGQKEDTAGKPLGVDLSKIVSSENIKKLNGQIQICERNAMSTAVSPVSNVTSELGIKLHFDREYLAGNNEMSLNLTYSVYESENILFYNLCRKNNFMPESQI